MKILVVDDDAVSIKILSILLQSIDYDVTMSSNGLEATKLLEKNSYDVLLTDIFMPLMDGLELLKKLKEEKSNMFLIGMTAGSKVLSKDLALSSAELYANRILKKPIQTDDLMNCLDMAEQKISKAS